MFFSNVAIAEKYDYLAPVFRAAYRWLRETSLQELPEGSYSISGEDAVANVQIYETEDAARRMFESHEKYFDIQYMVSGEEQFGVCRTDGLTEKERHPESDLIFYEEPEECGTVLLKEGDLIVVAPEDAHKPRCAASAPMQVKKVVVKIRLQAEGQRD